jgi:hypothetical protein
MQAAVIVSIAIAFLLALYELSWISESSLGIVLVGLAIAVGVQGIALYSILDKQQ